MKHLLTACSTAISAILCTSAIAQPSLTISTTTTSRDFPLTSDAPIVLPLQKDAYTVIVSGLNGDCSSTKNQKVKFRQPLSLNCGQETVLPVKIRFGGDYSFTFDSSAHTLSIAREAKASTRKTFTRPIPNVSCESFVDAPVTLDLGETFIEGTQLKDAISGQVVEVTNHQVTLTASKNNGGLVLLEPIANQETALPFTYKNANIYFVMIDRFNNGDTSNDSSYGRQKDGKQEVGTFHGGDLKGVIAKLDYIKSLGTDAIWLSPIVEQIHGFVGGGESGSFPFYAYHGYWTRDFTKIDQNFGNEEDLKTLVEEAHMRGIKILLDAVINHSGYSSLADLQFDNVEVVNSSALPTQWARWAPSNGENWHSFHQSIDYQHPNWSQWWGKDWVRAGLPGYNKPGSSDITMTLAGLPDFRTDSTQAVAPPQWLLDNPNTRVVSKSNYSVADYLIEWQTDWVKRFGIDGFRVDTVKHVEGEVWQRLKQTASDQLDKWRSQQGIDNDEPFWMMGEVWGHSAYRSPYVDQGFDALINFDMQKKLDKGAACFSQMSDVYRNYSESMQETPDFTPVSYMSSHDTELFFSRFKSYEMQKSAASALLLSPGAIQVYYGDEVARDLGPYADDFHQGTRSDMVWTLNAEQEDLLAHWKLLGQFRQRHPAIGAGVHADLTNDNAYVFSRTLGEDKVVVAYLGK